jgi:hypothetical protein
MWLQGCDHPKGGYEIMGHSIYSINILEIYLIYSQIIILRPYIYVTYIIYYSFGFCYVFFARGFLYPTKSDHPGICKLHQLMNFMEQVTKVLLVYTTTLASFAQYFFQDVIRASPT